MKHEFHIPYISRRNFLQRFGTAGLGLTVLGRTIRELRFLNTAVAEGVQPTDYKALICVFLNGGNDSNNMIIPTIPSEWANYAAIRGPAIALPNADGGPASALMLKNPGAADTAYSDADGHTYGFHPAMPEMAALFKAGAVAPVLNVGTLSFPLTKVQWSANSVPRPPQLFSHSDQQTQWQTSLPDQPITSGWGGRIADLLNATYNTNYVSGVPQSGGISMAVTLAGSNIFEVSSSNLAPPYSITTTGAVTISSVSGARRTALDAILTTDKASTNLQTQVYAGLFDQSIDQAESVNVALGFNDTVAKAPWLVKFTTNITTPNGGSTFGSGLMSQMKMVARLIDLGSRPKGVNGGLGMKRQIFFIQVGGYDTHSNQTNNQGSSTADNAKVILGDHANRLADLSQTLNALYQALSMMGVPPGSPPGTAPLKDCVTAFTASDFSRTFPGNGLGSDHGWGGHQLVMGGAVNGGATYGKFPTLAVNGPDDTSTGRWIPTTAVDQYAATIATWFGVDPAGIETVFPNLGRFSSPNLGFL
jgi:uncharacterized protein (DUF1501 family)